MRLLEHGADVDHRVDVLSAPLARVFPDRGLRTLGEKLAQREADCGDGIARSGKDVDAQAAVGLADVAEVDGLGVRQADDRRGVKAHADDEPLGQMLMGASPVSSDGRVVRRGPRRVAAVLDEIALERGRVRPALVCSEASSAAHSRSKSISSLAIGRRSAE